MLQSVQLWAQARGWGVGLVVVPPADHLLAGGAEQDGVLVLGSVAALDVAQRGVGLHYSNIAQVLQTHQVLGLSKSAQAGNDIH